MKKSILKITAGLLILSFGLICIPESLRDAFADEIQVVQANTVVEETEEIQRQELTFPTNTEEAYILSEDHNLRNRYRKAYHLSDGTVLTEQYSTPIHYLDRKAGRYKEIDNTLVEVTDETGTYYKNAANDYTVKIKKNVTQGNSVIEISKDEYFLSFEPVVAKQLSEKAVAKKIAANEKDVLQNTYFNAFESGKISKVEGISADKKVEIDYSTKKLTKPQFTPSVISEAFYNNFWNGSNLQYALNSSEINEAITINQRAEQYNYIFRVHAEGLSFMQQDDGSVSIYNSENEQLFCLKAPSLIDARGRTSVAVEYDVIENDAGRFLAITADRTWLNGSETVFPVKIQTDICIDANENDKNTFIETDDGAVLNMNDVMLPSYYFLTSASLKYSYESSFENASFEVCTVADATTENFGKISRMKQSTLVPAEENIASKANKVYTQVKKLDLATVSHENIAFGFIFDSFDQDISVYADGANAAVLSLQYDLNVGLNPDAVTEQFNGKRIQSHVNVYTRNLTTVIDCMSVNSNYMPINLQMVYNPTYDSYKNDLLALNNQNFKTTGMGRNFKLNLEQYCFVYSIDNFTDGFVLIDESGAVHEFEQVIRSDSYGKYYVCKDCNLLTAKVSYTQVTVYKNDYPYMFFQNGSLQWIATSNKCLRIGYDYVNGVHRISKVYNCLEGGSYSSPSTKEAQSVTFSYNGSNLLSSITSNYGETVSFTYDSSQRLTKVSRGSFTLASIGYDSSGRLNQITDSNHLGYEFTYSDGNKINTVYGINSDGTNASAISKATFTEFGTTKKVNITTSGQETLTHQYAFNSSARCESSYSGYINYQNETTPRNSVAIYSKQPSGNVRTNTAFSYTEDFSQIGNGSFESITGNSPTGWNVNTSNTDANYTTNNSGKALWLTANSSASRSYSFNNRLKTSYVLGFFAEAWGQDCNLKVSVSGKSLTQTIKVSYYGQYYAINVFDSGTTANSGTIKFENLCSSHSIKIDNVTFSPIDQYAEVTWNAADKTQTNKTITSAGESVYKINNDNQIFEEKYTDYLSGTITTKTNDFSPDDKRLNKTETVNKKGNNIIAKETVDITRAGTSTQSIVTYTDNTGNTLKTLTSTETDIYGYPIKEIGANGEKTYYFYENTQNNYRLIKTVSCNNASAVAAGASHDSHTYDYVIAYTYNSYGECSSVSDGANTNSITDYHNGGAALYGGSGQSWKTDVNVYGNPTAIYESGNSVKQIQYTYGSNQSLSRATYNRSSVNQSYADYTYDSYGNLKSEKWYDKNGSSATAINSSTYSYAYDYENYKQTVTSNGTSYLYQAYVNNNPLSSKIAVSGNNYNASYTYNGRSDGLLASASYNINGLTRNYVPQYNDKKQIVSETDGSDFKSEYTYDEMGRVTKYSLTKNSMEICYNTYSYGINETFGNEYTVNRVTNNFSTSTESGGGAYNYDALGRITKITKNRTSATEIYYDKYNRLRSIEINGYYGTWYSYLYDSNNNLTEIRKREPNGPPVAQRYITYSYNSKNQLTSYEKSGVKKYYSYDNLGNPVKYGVSSTTAADNMVWTQGTKLASGSYNGNNFSYKYNADGLRYEKTVNGITTRMYLEGDKVIAEEKLDTDGTLTSMKYYIYDQTGIAGMIYNGQTYYFLKNLFGDVIAIYNSSGSQVASYAYDVWGNQDYIYSSGVGLENPFRYRGYYYDNETGFYYLQSRYYDPEICRFISADNLELLPALSQTAGQLNLYAYCNNNPVNYTDPSGEGIFLALAILLTFTVAGGVAGGVISYNNGLRGWDVFKNVMLGASIGLATGGAIVMLGGITSGALHFFNIGSNTFLGMASRQAFAIGALAFNFTAFVVTPIYGIEMQGIDYETPKPSYKPSERQLTPPHPFLRPRRHR